MSMYTGVVSNLRVAQLRDQIAFRERALPVDRQRVERSIDEVLTELVAQHKAFCDIVGKLGESLMGRATHVRELMISSAGEARDLSRERSDVFDAYLSLNRTLSAYQTQYRRLAGLADLSLERPVRLNA